MYEFYLYSIFPNQNTKAAINNSKDSGCLFLSTLSFVSVTLVISIPFFAS